MARSKVLLGVVATTIVLLVFFFLLEIIARVAYPLYSDYNTEMWRYAVEVKNPSGNPFVSHVHAPNVCSDLYGAQICTDSLGFRGTGDDLAIPKPDGVFRVLLVGDSVTLGWGVKDNNTIRSRLEEKLSHISSKKVEVANSGIGNYNTQMEYELLKQKGMKIDPDLIVLGYYINDAERTKSTSNFMLWFKEHSYLYAFFWDKYANILPRLSTQNTFEGFYSALYEPDFEGRIVAEKSLRNIIALASQKEIPLLIMVFPEFHNFEDYQFQYVTNFVGKIAEEGQVPFLDLLPYYTGYTPEDIWVSYEDAHPNSLGNKIATNALYETLINKELISQES